MIRTARHIKIEIAGTKMLLRRLRAELRRVHAANKAAVVGERQKGAKLDDIARKLDLSRPTVIAILRTKGVKRPTPALHTLPIEQQRTYRKIRRNGVPAAEARAAAAQVSP